MSIHSHSNPFTRVDPRVYKAGRPPYAEGTSAYLLDTLTAAFGRVPIDDALDVGAGTGLFTALLMPLANRIVASDPVADSLEHIEVPDVETVVCPAEHLLLPDASFDLVTCANALHWTKRDKALAEMARVLRPGGVLVIAWNLPMGFHRAPFNQVAESILRYNPTWVGDRVEQLTGWPDLEASPDFDDLKVIEWPLSFDWQAPEVLEFYKSTSFAGGDIPEQMRPALWSEIATLLETIATPTVPCRFLTRLEVARKKNHE